MRQLKGFVQFSLLGDLLFKLLGFQPQNLSLSPGRIGVVRHLQDFESLISFFIEDHLAPGVVLLEMMQR